MIFEEALKQMREGKKIRHPTFETDEYFQACKQTFPSIFDDEGKKIPEIDLGIAMVKMKGEFIHPDDGRGGGIDRALGKLLKDGYEPPCKHGYHPQISLIILMSDKWEVFD